MDGTDVDRLDVDVHGRDGRTTTFLRELGNNSEKLCPVVSRKSESADTLVGTSSSLDGELDCLSCYERCPSPSDLADAASRLLLDAPGKKG